MASQAAAAQQSVKLTDLPVQTLSQLKKQLDEEIQHLTTSFQQLRAAQNKFKECLKSLSSAISSGSKDRAILVPLTASLYVPGTLADSDNVLVDVGTGFYVEKDRASAKKFYEGKIVDLSQNLEDLEKIINGKGDNLQLVEEVLRQKILEQQSGPEASTSSGAKA